LDALTYAGNKRNLEPLLAQKRIKFLHDDITNELVMKRIVRDFDCVVNFAAESHVDRSIENPVRFLETNVLGVLNILKAIENRGIRLLQVSTDEVYGSLNKGFATEKFPIRTGSPYSASKASADLLCQSFFNTYNTNVVITRCSNNYGPRQYPEKLIPLAINKLLTGEKVPIYGDGKNVRNWIHVLDHAEGISLALTRGKAGQIYNFGSQESFSNLSLVRKIIKYKDDYYSFVTDRKGHDFRYGIDFTKASKHLGFKPTRKLNTSLGEIVSWYKSLTNESITKDVL
jgi:dTDP-glucose 4,6-dehydratase